MPAQMKEKRKSLMNQYNKLEREYEKLMDNIPKGGLSKKDDDRRRELQLMLRQISSDLGDMSPPDKRSLTLGPQSRPD